MNADRHTALRALVAGSMALAVGSRPWAAEPQLEQQPVQLQRNIHEMRIVLDRERAQLENAARLSSMPLVVDSSDAPSIGTMREQLTRSLERLENRCFGVDLKVKDGNAILICGNNNGAAENSNITSASQTTLVLPPVTEGAAEPTTQSETAP